MSIISQGLVRFDEYELDRARWRLTWRTEVIPLNRKTFDLLLYFVDHRERVVGKEELMQALWPGQFVEDSNLTQHVFLLRKALSRHDSDVKFIETVPGRGYRFSAAMVEDDLPVSTLVTTGENPSSTGIPDIEEQGYEVSAPGSDGDRVPATFFVHGHRLLLAGMLVVGLAAGWLAWQHWQNHVGGPPVQILVMPIEGTTGDRVLDKSLNQAMRMDLSQSPYVTLVPGATVNATLTEMMHQPDDTITVAMAREICERTNSQGILAGNIAKYGEHFLITEEVSNCVDGSVMASGKDESAKPEDLPGSIDKLAAGLRRKLGESRSSIARFDTPLVPMTTASLQALKAYTQSVALSGQGKWADAIVLLQEAIRFDPNFAAARYDLAAAYLSTGDLVNGRSALVKAYELRGTASEPVRLSITALYQTYSTQDLYAAESNYRSWTELYPRSAQAWNGLSVVQRELGQHAESAASGLRALALRPGNQGLYANAAYEQMRSGDVQGARSTLDAAIAHHLDGDQVRADYAAVALLLQDSSVLQAQHDWIDAHSQAVYCHIEELEEAIGLGQFADAHHRMAQLTALLHAQGLPGLADPIAKLEGINLAEAGDTDAGFRLFHTAAVDKENGNDLLGLAESGDGKTAMADLQAMRVKYPEGTLWKLYWQPLIEARVAIQNHKPEKAIALLEASRPIEKRSLDVPLLRGDAYLAAGQSALAEKEYRTVLGQHQVSAGLGSYPLSWLGLARALAAEGSRPAALEAYSRFLTIWNRADPDAAYLQAARKEVAELQAR